MFQVVRVPDDAADLTEQLGSKRKFWFLKDDALWLFKQTTEGTGEDWSEKVAAELAALLGMPHADYELAMHRGERGVITPSFVPDKGRLILGNELLAKIVDEYQGAKRFHNRQHTLRVVMGILKQPVIASPIGWRAFEGAETAVDFFVGYLMLDCWIANQDRHHENWALVLTGDLQLHLAPSFDHASSLGRNESDEARMDRLTTTDTGRSVERFVERARSAFYHSRLSQRPMTTLKAFQQAAKLRPEAANAWLNRLERICPEAVDSIFSSIPEDWISAAAGAFAKKMLELNRARLLASREEWL